MCIIYLVLGGGRKSTNIRLAMGVKTGGDAAKSGKNTNLLVIMCVRLSHKIGLPGLTNRTLLTKGNG